MEKNKTTPKKKPEATKEWAKLMYTREDVTQKDVALRVGINEKTVKRWIDEGHWDALKITLSSSHEAELRNLYECLALLNEHNKEMLRKGLAPDTDGAIKLAKAIHYLEHKTGIGETYQTCIAILDSIRRVSLDHAQLFTSYMDEFIKERLNTFKNG